MKLQEVKSLMEELGIQANKSLGQNFLIEPAVIKKIIDIASASFSEKIVEVGPGLGSLTNGLMEIDKPLELIELDKALAEYWSKRSQSVHHQDALKFDWSEVKGDSLALVSNLPYQISSSLVVEMSCHNPRVKEMVLMFQKEVAQKITTSPKSADYGMLSVISQSFWEVERVVDASPSCFFPPPKIASRVLKFTRKETPLQQHSKKFLNFIKEAFSQRRKVVAKRLFQFLRYQGSMEEALEEWQISATMRAEEIDVEHFSCIFLQEEGKRGN